MVAFTASWLIYFTYVLTAYHYRKGIPVYQGLALICCSLKGACTMVACFFDPVTRRFIRCKELPEAEIDEEELDTEIDQQREIKKQNYIIEDDK